MLQIREGERVSDYICLHIDEDRIFVGVEGDELALPEAVRLTGNKPYLFSSDYPHEVDAGTCKAELDELRDNADMSPEDKEAIMYRNSGRFYRLAAN